MFLWKHVLTETAVDIIKIVQPVDIRTFWATTGIVLPYVIPGGVAGMQKMPILVGGVLWQWGQDQTDQHPSNTVLSDPEKFSNPKIAKK